MLISDDDNLDMENEDLELHMISKAKQTSKPAKPTQNTEVPSSGEEFDGRTALRAVEEAEA